jgi:hypothetical protein
MHNTRYLLQILKGRELLEQGTIILNNLGAEPVMLMEFSYIFSVPSEKFGCSRITATYPFYHIPFNIH